MVSGTVLRGGIIVFDRVVVDPSWQSWLSCATQLCPLQHNSARTRTCTSDHVSHPAILSSDVLCSCYLLPYKPWPTFPILPPSWYVRKASIFAWTSSPSELCVCRIDNQWKHWSSSPTMGYATYVSSTSTRMRPPPPIRLSHGPWFAPVCCNRED